MGKKDDHMFVTVKHLFEDKMGEHQNINESKINEQKIPEDILDLAREYREQEGMSYKEIVNNILDWPRGKKWFEEKYTGGNEFDLRHDLEELIEQNESKINEQDEEEIPQEEDSGVPSNQKGVEPDNSEPSEGEEEEGGDNNDDAESE